MAVQVAQVAAPLILLVVTFICGTFPALLVKKMSQNGTGTKVLSFLICLGGGVLFATCFLHLIPEVREGFEEEHSHFPLTETIVCAGFLAVYVLEEVLHALLGHAHEDKEHGHSHSPSVISCTETTENGTAAAKAPEPSSSHTHTHAPVGQTNITVSGILIVAALSFHSLFEGLALGLQDTEKKTWLIFLAVGVHKFVISFVVGFEICTSGVRRMAVLVYMGIFSLMSPIGALIGILTRENVTGTSISVLNGIASGTLLYVTFFEVLQRQKNTNISGLLQLLAVIIGFSIIFVIEITLPHEHDHGHGGEDHHHHHH